MVAFPRARPQDIPALQLGWIHVVAHLESCELVREQHTRMTPMELARCRHNTLVVDDVLYPGIVELVSLTMHPTVVGLAQEGSRIAAVGLDALADRAGDEEVADVAAFLHRKVLLFAEAAARQDALPPDERAYVDALTTDPTESAMAANAELGWCIHPDVLEPLFATFVGMQSTLDRYLDEADRP